MEERNHAPALPRGLSDLLDDEEVAYRPVSVLAVVGAALAGVSLLALVTPWLAPAPVVATVVSLVAARRIEKDPTSQSGWGIAAAALAVSLLALGAVAVKQPFTKHLHAEDAAKVTDRFIERLAEKDYAGAFELTLPLSERQATPELTASLYESDETLKERLTEFTGRAKLPPAAETDEAAPRRTGKAEVAVSSSARVVAAIPYRIAASGETLRVRAERTGSSRWGGVSWRVLDFELVPAAE
jgi:hypothetical protein